MQSTFKEALKENVFKNISIIVLTFLFLSQIQNSVSTLSTESINDFLLIVSMLLVTVCFANFAFSYEYSKVSDFGMRLLSHFATFLFMFLIALLLATIVIGISKVYPELYFLILFFSILLYVGIALYDFWDFLRAFHK